MLKDVCMFELASHRSFHVEQVGEPFLVIVFCFVLCSQHWYMTRQMDVWIRLDGMVL